ncbi:MULTISPECIES: hypothetical protein [Streptomyces]|uniref:Uncharacterized protein n=1 Tax=Streptomyces fradiae ATCC 10745 = DSM 40063 TaxID=1319510 RepID=A0A1Y2NNL5_STRFR|nr:MULTISPECIES: hypothetical protein [Streptomyces]KAF0646299.1 hypothetical protein K701_29480 [Streptomyces fradiae ATCC 10745 = DSM 40063]OSY49083.1 hypothetical protein BG846_05322 [Streptomyces fradiae ATCC 10745 = DSM 40063]
MDLARTPEQIADAAAEQVRELNHRTINADAFYGEDGFRGAAPARLSGTVQGLLALTQRLPQSLQQIRRSLAELEQAQEIRMADGQDPADAVSTALRALLNAEEAFKAAEHALQTASTPMSAMGGYLGEPEDSAVS